MPGDTRAERIADDQQHNAEQADQSQYQASLADLQFHQSSSPGSLSVLGEE